MTTHCRLSAEEERPPKDKAKRKFYVKRDFFHYSVQFYTCAHQAIALPTPNLKKKKPGDSLVVQWLGLCAFTAKGPGSTPGQGTKILQAVQCGQNKKTEVAHCSIIYSSIKQGQNQCLPGRKQACKLADARTQQAQQNGVKTASGPADWRCNPVSANSKQTLWAVYIKLLAVFILGDRPTHVSAAFLIFIISMYHTWDQKNKSFRQ